MEFIKCRMTKILKIGEMKLIEVVKKILDWLETKTKYKRIGGSEKDSICLLYIHGNHSLFNKNYFINIEKIITLHLNKELKFEFELNEEGVSKLINEIEQQIEFSYAIYFFDICNDKYMCYAFNTQKKVDKLTVQKILNDKIDRIPPLNKITCTDFYGNVLFEIVGKELKEDFFGNGKQPSKICK